MKPFFQQTFIGVFAIVGIFWNIAGAENLLQSTQSGLDDLDIVAPQIISIKAPEKVYAGVALKIKVQASDDQGIKSVAIYFRRKGTKQYTKMEMIQGSGTNEYYAVIKDVSSPAIEYYLEAMDLAGNLVRDGQASSPHSVTVLSELDPSVINNLKSGPLSGQDILTLFSNNTVDGHHVRKNFTFTRYFAADGRLLEKNTKKGARAGRWRVKGKTLCERFENQRESCREIVKEDNTIKKYTTTGKGERVVAIVYKRFRYGNPENF